jgi:hypothetical protein
MFLTNDERGRSTIPILSLHVTLSVKNESQGLDGVAATAWEIVSPFADGWVIKKLIN